jgi:hypothetical protein
MIALWGPIAGFGSTGGAYNGLLAGYRLDDADDAMAYLYILERAENITHVGFYATVNGAPPAYNVAITTIDASGRPTQTPYANGAVQTWTPTTTGWVWLELSPPGAATVGDFVFLHIWPTATAPTGTNCVTLVDSGSIRFNGYYSANFATSWARTGRDAGWHAIRYASNILQGLQTVSLIQATGITSVRDPDEYGAKFSLPFTVRCIGGLFANSSFTAAGADLRMRLYDGESNAQLANAQIDFDLGRFSSGNSHQVRLSFAPVTLIKHRPYRLTMFNTSTGTGETVRFYPCRLQLEPGSSRHSVWGGSNWIATYRTDEGAWTDEADKLAMMGIVFDTIYPEADVG